MSAQISETPALAFTFQARRFACDRCHRYKLKCDRGPLIMTSGMATPLGPCKRCEKARAECTSSNAAASSTPRRKETDNNGRPSKQAKTINTNHSPNAANSSTDRSDELRTFSPLPRPSFTTLDPALTDPSLFLENFDFDLDGGGDHFDRVDVASTVAGGLSSPNTSQASDSNTRLRMAEQFPNQENDPVESLPAISELLNTSSTESADGLSGPHVPLTVADSRDRIPHADPLTETLDRLSELQTFIFKGFGSIPEESLISTFMSPDPGSSLCLGSASPDGNLVGKVLYASERLMDILASCGRHEVRQSSVAAAPLRPRRDTLNGSKRNYSNLFGHDDILRADPVSPSAANSMTTRLGLLRKITFGNEGTSSFQRTTADTKFETSMYSGLLSSSKLTLLTCYVTLLGVYRLILSQAFDMLRFDWSPASASHTQGKNSLHDANANAPVHTNPHPLNGATIMGFRIQVEMLTHTLERIDDAWAAALQRGSELQGGQHRDGVTSTRVLLQNMLTHEGFDCEDESDAVGLGSLMLQVEAVKRALRCHSAAHKQ
ncbi:MAG: hypothetical protein Q9197_000877 [Variospora fuerteventurae]